jgi:FkbM family methyltransferase
MLLKTIFAIVRHWSRYARFVVKGGLAKSYSPRIMKIEYKSDFLERNIEFICLQNDDFAKMAKYGQLDNWEYAELKIFFDKCKEKTNLVDCGASIGMYSKIAMLANPHNKVQSFEPNPWTRHALVKNLKEFGHNSKVYHYALGDLNGRRKLLMPRDNLFTSSAKLENEDLTESRIWYKGISVEVRTLDFLIEIGEIEVPNVLKIDVEGFELHVLKGARELLMSHKPIIFFEALSKVRLREITSYLSQYGYIVNINADHSVRNFVAI